MAGMLTLAILIMLAVRVFGHGQTIELQDLLGIPQIAALAAVTILILVVVLRFAAGEAAITMVGLSSNGLMLVLFPERMPDTERGGTLMTAFWSGFGGLLILIAWIIAVVLMRHA